MRNGILLLWLLLLSNPLFAGILTDAAEGYATIAETGHQLRNFKAMTAFGLMVVIIRSIGKLNGTFRPALSIAISVAIWVGVVMCAVFFVDQYRPEIVNIYTGIRESF